MQHFYTSLLPQRQFFQRGSTGCDTIKLFKNAMTLDQAELVEEVTAVMEDSVVLVVSKVVEDIMHAQGMDER
eukprot:15059918-Ditylum_brightwellii.AAC.1